ncbi:acyl-CoA dehydrogenase family protein [Sphingobacterium cellulitidis]|uniref:acyl-CoA dehydrogenase family protein n=1 Tax=Sphingobacterium cellulitidis TaxID=1768011 RepID=UPI000B94477C|nr:acyl-CoA dehydrogenase [Sphingobacterium cellulitidis]
MLITPFSPEHEAFRDSLRSFIKKEILPYVDDWEKQGSIDRSIWKKMGEMGYLGLIFPEEYGGLDLDFYYSLIFCEELSHCYSGGFTISALVIEYMSATYIWKYADENLKSKYLSKVISGDWVSAIAITEPGAGSDVQNLKTTAVDAGDHYVVNGSKTFITNGYYADFIITAVKTKSNAGSSGISLLIIDRDSVGVTATKIQKMGWLASDTAELGFDQVKVPKENLIGELNQGFKYLMGGLQLERLTAAIHSLASTESAVNYTLDYLKERTAFNKQLKDFQVIRHRVAQMFADITVLKSFLYYCCELQNQKRYAVKECSIAKLQCGELAVRVIGECLQLFGGYGFTEDYRISRLYRDARVGTIIAGTSEIMLEILSKIYIDGVDYERK